MSVDEVTNARRSSLRESLTLNTQRLLKTTAPKIYSALSVISVVKNKTVLICVNQCLNTIRENLWLNFIPYLKKQTQFYAVFGPKTAFCQKTNPIQSQLNPIQTQFFGLKMNNLVYPACPAIVPQGRRRIIFSKNTVLICVNQCLNIIRVNSWNLLLKNFSVNSVSSVAINKSVKSAKSASKINAFYAKRTQTSPFSAQKPRFCQKTNPKQTQNKPKQSQMDIRQK